MAQAINGSIEHDKIGVPAFHSLEDMAVTVTAKDSAAPEG